MATTRHTRQRQMVLDIVRAAQDHPDATRIHDDVRRHLPHISLGTVYRVLDRLVEQGDLIKLHVPGEAARYDAPTPRHHHLICAFCGGIQDLHLTPGDLEGVLRHLPRGARFENLTMLVHGVCAPCTSHGDPAQAS
ncbi:Fur family transcriptional regulator [Deinococcus soli (ex Cha et al. 2016)]|uniref:Fur family transcriptional regulator n=1 Tax=Deinococcus soli (ex Cha et al. 2016) TaxID=1309411 RepID=UPI00166D0879|nr:transcriptional repressor [Deinococcus soli (ex Cha et al. 2016)]GGB84172.1 transcriptional repressor [Deinococcus soli (ex Cha et al. 2016)]